MSVERRRWGSWERHRRLQVRVVGLVGVLSMAVAGCGSSRGPAVASLSRHSPTTTAGANFDADMVAYAHCMRARGADVPDPVHRPGHAGLSLVLPDAESDNPVFQAADGACRHLLSGLIAMKQAHQPVLSGTELDALAAYAACMRAHQIDMLDPTPQGALNLGDVPGIAASTGRYSPEFRAADQACRHLLPRGVRDDGTGP